MGNDLWFAEMERLLNDKLDKGMAWDKAYEQASDEAQGSLVERMADLADFERKRRKEEGK